MGIDKRYKFEIVSQYRTELMGTAILMVMLFHSYIRLPQSLWWLMPIVGSTNSGVDIFFVLSGVGLFFSMKKHGSVKEFYIGRVKKILIPAFAAILIWGIVRDLIVGHKPIIEFIEDVTLVSFWTRGLTSYWYMASLIVFYAAYPGIYQLIIKKHACLYIPMLIICIVALTVLYRHLFPEHYELIEIFLTRIPVFLIGCLLGRVVYEQRTCSKKFILLFVAVFLLPAAMIYMYWFGALNDYMPIRYSLGCIGIGVVLLLPILFNVVSCKLVKRILSFFGRHTLEIYLVFMQVSAVVNYLFDRMYVFSDKYGILRSLVCAAAYIAVALIYRRIIDCVVKQVEKRAGISSVADSGIGKKHNATET